MYVKKSLIFRVEWMKGICHMWSRGRHFFLSLPPCLVTGSWNLTHQSNHPGRNFGKHRSVRRSGTTSRSTACSVSGLRMRSFPEHNFLPYARENYRRKVNYSHIRCTTRTRLSCPSSVILKFQCTFENHPKTRLAFRLRRIHSHFVLTVLRLWWE